MGSPYRVHSVILFRFLMFSLLRRYRSILVRMSSSIGVALGEQTQAALARLRSPEFGMRIVQLQQAPLGVSAAAGGLATPSDINIAAAMWKSKHNSGNTSDAPALTLPVVLLEYYKTLQSDGLHFAVSALRGSVGSVTTATTPASGAAATVPAAAPVASSGSSDASALIACCKLNSITHITPVHVDPSLVELPHHRSPAGSSEGAAAHSAAPVSQGDAAITSVRCFVLSSSVSPDGAAPRSSHQDGSGNGPRSPLCDVLLVYRSSGLPNNPEVWGRNPETGRYFYLCRCVEDYIRLGCRMYWVSGWQLCYDDSGCPPWSLPWLRMLAPAALLQALRCASST